MVYADYILLHSLNTQIGPNTPALHFNVSVTSHVTSLPLAARKMTLIKCR